MSMWQRGVGVGLLAILTAGTALGQGLIVDRRPQIELRGSYEVKAVDVDGTVRDQVAEVQVRQTFHNPGARGLEVEYLFPIPRDAAVSDLTLIVDGKEMPGKLLTAGEAREIYESIVRRQKDPALLEYLGQGLLKSSAFPIAAGGESSVVLRYTQLMPKRRDLVRFVHPLGAHRVTGKPIGRFTLHLRVTGDRPLKAVYSPTHDVAVQRPNATTAHVRFEQSPLSPRGAFELYYQRSGDELGATLLSYRPDAEEDGYFLLLASPGFQDVRRRPMAKTVVFVIDKSGSMAGQKIEQAREALRFVLHNLNEDDTFNIIAYDDRVETFKPELQRYDERSRGEALAFVAGIRHGGSTNIDAALTAAMGMVRDPDRPSYVLFLTDGLPTAGEQNEMKIAENVADANRRDARLIAFGVGYDVNARLLDRLSHGNGGQSEYVRPDEDLEAAVSRFYGRLTDPVLSKLSIELVDRQTNRTYPRDLPDLFAGGQLVWVGRYADGGETTIRLTGQVDGQRRTYLFPAELVERSDDEARAFVEKLWAVRRVGYLIDLIDLHGRSDELVNEVVALSTKHGILTPYTSFLADENASLDRLALQAEAGARFDRELRQVHGQSGTAQRCAKGAMMQANQAPAAAPALAADADGLYEKAEAENIRRNVRHVGVKTFYRKQGVWIDATLADLDESGPAAPEPETIEQYSDRYFEFVDQLPPDQRQYVTFTDPVEILIQGRRYRIVPPDQP